MDDSLVPDRPGKIIASLNRLMICDVTVSETHWVTIASVGENVLGRFFRTWLFSACGRSRREVLGGVVADGLAGFS